MSRPPIPATKILATLAEAERIHAEQERYRTIIKDKTRDRWARRTARAKLTSTYTRGPDRTYMRKAGELALLRSPIAIACVRMGVARETMSRALYIRQRHPQAWELYTSGLMLLSQALRLASPPGSATRRGRDPIVTAARRAYPLPCMQFERDQYIMERTRDNPSEHGVTANEDLR